MLKKIQTPKKLLIFLLLLSVNTAYAQFTPVNTLDVKATYIPESNYKQREGSTEDTKKSQKRIDLGYSFLISDHVDTAAKKINRWTGMINGSYTQLTEKSSPTDIIPNRLLSTQLGVSYFHSMNKKWSMVNILSTGINSDLKKIDYHDLYITGGVLFINNYSPDFQFGLGGFIVNALNAPILLPGIVIHFQTNGKFKFNVDLPTEISTAYQTSKNMELKLAFRLRSMSYDTENTVDPKKRYLNYTEFPIGLENKWKSKHFDFVIGGGYVLARNFVFKEAGLKNVFKKEPINKLGGNVFINTSIRYRL